MELNQLISQLLNSGILENQELGTTMLSSDRVSDEDKMKFIEQFITEYTKNPMEFWTEEKRNLLNNWIELYRKFEINIVKCRVQKI